MICICAISANSFLQMVLHWRIFSSHRISLYRRYVITSFFYLQTHLHLCHFLCCVAAQPLDEESRPDGKTKSFRTSKRHSRKTSRHVHLFPHSSGHTFSSSPLTPLFPHSSTPFLSTSLLLVNRQTLPGNLQGDPQYHKCTFDKSRNLVASRMNLAY